MAPPLVLPEDVQRHVAGFLSTLERQVLRLLPPFRQGATSVIHEHCDNLIPLLRLLCNKTDGIPHENWSTCLGRPELESCDYPEKKALFDFYASKIRSLQVDETKMTCAKCFYYAPRALAQDDLLPAVITARLNIVSMYGLRAITILPRTLSILRLSVSPTVDMSTIVTLLSRFDSLEELYLRFHQPEHAKALALHSLFAIPMRALRIFSVKDTIPVAYSSCELESFLHTHPRVARLYLNPAPSIIVESSTLQTDIACLDVVSRQRSQMMQEFGMLIHLGKCFVPQHFGTVSSSRNLHLLDLGRSQLPTDNFSDFLRYISERFPHATVRSSLEGVAGVFNA